MRKYLFGMEYKTILTDCLSKYGAVLLLYESDNEKVRKIYVS